MDASSIVGAGWRQFTANFAQNFGIALKGTLWTIAPLIIALAAGSLFVQQTLGGIDNVTRDALQPYTGLLVLATVALIVFSFYCFAQSLGYFLGISRLTFQRLSGITEPAKTALRFTRSRKYALLWTSIWQGMILFVAYITGIFLMSMLAVAAAAVLNISPTNPPSLPTLLLVGLLGALTIIALLSIYVWLIVRLMLSTQPLAIEQQSDVTQAISRSWQLTRKHVWHCILVSLLTFLISLPISIVTYLISNAVMAELFGTTVVEPDGSLGSMATFLFATLISTIISALGSVITTPLWQSVLAALYFDLRNRLNQPAALQPKPAITSSQ